MMPHLLEKSMPVFALTGAFASGKSTALTLFKRRGAGVFDLDKRIHAYYRNKESVVSRRLIRLFPEAVVKGKISREKLGGIVFSDRKQLRRLEAVVHPVILKDMKQWVREKQRLGGIYIVEVPLLFEKGLQRLFDGVILVFARREVCLRRARAKYGSSRTEFKNRLALFMPLKRKVQKSDFVLNNNSTKTALTQEVGVLWKKLKSYKQRKP
jgi:dephospho-CoA kinase